MADIEESIQPQPAEPDHPILVAIDFSENSRAALYWACVLAGCTRARLVLLHVIHDPACSPGFYQTGGKDGLQPMDAIAESMLAEFLAESIQQRPDLEILQRTEMRLAEGLPPGRIVEIADLLDARLIVLGSRGISGLPHVLLGSVAERVVSQAERSVAVIRTAKDEKPETLSDG